MFYLLMFRFLSKLVSYIEKNSHYFINCSNLNLDISSSFFINNLFIGHTDSIIQLLEIAKSFSSQFYFKFYTDGSLFKTDFDNQTPTQMGFAWIEVSGTDNSPHLPPLIYNGALSFNPSSTKAELYVLLTAIIAVPNNSILDVHTDSQYVIHTFHKITNKLTSIRQTLKCNNYLAWRLINTLITKKQLTVHLHKVKAHSNDLWNDMADDLAKTARSLPPIEINPISLPGSLMTPIWACIAPIDRDIRKFCHNITDAYTFNKFLGNTSLSLIFDRFPISSIHWPLTQSWLYHNSTTDICSSTKSSYDSFKIKSLNHRSG